MNYEEMLLNLVKMVNSIRIPSVVNADEISLASAREQKDKVIKEIHHIRKLMKDEINEELQTTRAYIHDNGLEWDLLSHYKEENNNV